MKTQFIFLTIFLLGMVTSNYVTAQTNTFPSSGKVGIGTLSPSNPLTIRSTENSQLRIINPNSTTGTKAGLSLTTGGGWEIWLNTSKDGNWLELTDKSGNVKQKWINQAYYAGMFYDINNTNYYLDPSSTSTSLKVAGNIIAQKKISAEEVEVNELTSSNINTDELKVMGYVSFKGYRSGDFFQVTNQQENVPANSALIWGSYGWGTSQSNNPYLLALTKGYSYPFVVRNNGQVGINCDPGNSTYMLTVNGNILAEKVRVTTDVPSADYVFEEGYALKSIDEVESYIKTNKHLPDVPSAAEFEEEGYNIGEMDEILLRKLEEQTLYIIEMNKRIEQLESIIEILTK